MTASSGSRSLADDEEAFVGYGRALVVAVDEVVAGWIERSITNLVPDVEVAEQAQAAASEGRRSIVAELEQLVGADIDDQRIGPLEVLRRGVRFATAVLAEASVAPVERDEFDVRNFPDDVYGLTPASFADVDPSLHEPALVWGAAKAHVHLRRRREAQAPAGPPMVVALSVDLMDRSKIQGAFPEARLVRSAVALIEAVGAADLVFIDLGRADAEAVAAAVAAAGPGAEIVAFGSHVDEAALSAAAATGATAVARSVFFKRIASGWGPEPTGHGRPS